MCTKLTTYAHRADNTEGSLSCKCKIQCNVFAVKYLICLSSYSNHYVVLAVLLVIMLSNTMHQLPFYILLTYLLSMCELEICESMQSVFPIYYVAISSLNISLPKMASIQSLPIQLARYTKMLFTPCNDRISFFKSNLFITL